MAAPSPPATADDWIFQPDRNVIGPAPTAVEPPHGVSAGVASAAYPAPAGRRARHRAPALIRAEPRRTMLNKTAPSTCRRLWVRSIDRQFA